MSMERPVSAGFGGYRSHDSSSTVCYVIRYVKNSIRCRTRSAIWFLSFVFYIPTAEALKTRILGVRIKDDGAHRSMRLLISTTNYSGARW
jgi:hypothetical protein